MSLAQHAGAQAFLCIDVDSVCLALPTLDLSSCLKLRAGGKKWSGNMSDYVPDSMQNNAMYVPPRPPCLHLFRSVQFLSSLISLPPESLVFESDQKIPMSSKMHRVPSLPSYIWQLLFCFAFMQNHNNRVSHHPRTCLQASHLWAVCAKSLLFEYSLMALLSHSWICSVW